MQRIVGAEYETIRPFFEQAAEAARHATCLCAKCGSVIVKNSVVIASGYNAPPLGDESQRYCTDDMDYSLKSKYDKTCCVHAEWNAVIDACKTNADKLTGSVLYFMRIDENGDFTDAGEPYCTTCSRFTMQAGVADFALYNNDGADIYSLLEYNATSYQDYTQSSRK